VDTEVCSWFGMVVVDGMKVCEAGRVCSAALGTKSFRAVSKEPSAAAWRAASGTLIVIQFPLG
jgi:hypothetical protein